MNVHHLELFYYVARHGGVSAAARGMPYGIQQPAISAQILQLEDALGAPLYRRRPFQLTREGRLLYEHIQPFFSGLEDVASRIRGGGETRLRLAAAEVVQREYLPELLRRMRDRVQGFHFTMTYGNQREIEALLEAQEIDIGLAVLADKVSPGIKSRDLVQLPLVLLVPSRGGPRSAREIFGKDRIDIPLVALDSGDALSRTFQAALRKRGVDWIPSVEVGSLELVIRYVAEGFGAGLALQHPRVVLARGVRALPLEGFPPLKFGAIWKGRNSALGETFLSEATAFADELD